ncbi:hypothetical protein FIBSPDRAFT_967829 [Athelia psychrophila]|uniref:Uncharacterized protein n=1 Tax=Athelia psychrophila TaxID=1759441 RepID=A0A167V9P8_9AGAM|nr:hypothetical protein FIBSPDRAFT_967829 [Fibularhizoctonia sp. CBS 109695]
MLELGVLEERMHGAERAPGQETGKVRSQRLALSLLGQVEVGVLLQRQRAMVLAVSSKNEQVELVGAKNESDGASSGRLKLSGPTHDNSNDAKVTLESAKSKSKSDGASSTEEDGASSAKEDGLSSAKEDGVSGPKEDSPKEDGAEEDSTKRMGHSKKNGPTKENSNDAKVM